MESGWIEGIQKNKVIVVPAHGKKHFLPANRIAFSWQEKKIAENAVSAHESLELQLKQAEQFKQTFELETMHSLLEEIREYTLEELAADFLDDPNDSVCKLGLFLSLRTDSFWFKHNRNLTYTPRTDEELELIKNLSKNITIPIAMWDERLSSEGSFKITKELGTNVSNRVNKLDKNAAAFILQGAIDYLSN